MKPLKLITPWMKEFIVEGIVNPAIEAICDQLTNFQELDFMALSNFIHKKSKRTFKKLANEVNELHIPDLKLKNLVFQSSGSRQETFQDEVLQDQVTPEPEISTSSHVYQPDIAFETEAQSASPRKKKKKKKKKKREKTSEEIAETEAVICDTLSSNEPSTSEKSSTPLTELFMKLLSYLDELNSDAKQHIEEEIFSIISSRINSSEACDTSKKSKKKKKRKSVVEGEVIDLISDEIEAPPETSKKRKNEDVDEIDIPRKKKKKKKENVSDEFYPQSDFNQPEHLNDINADDAYFNHNLSNSGEQRHSLENDEFGPSAEQYLSHPTYISSQTNSYLQPRDSSDFQYELNSMSDTNSESSIVCFYHTQQDLAAATIKVEQTSGLENETENQEHPIDSLPDELAKKSKKKKHSSKKDKSSKRNSSDCQPDPPDQSSTGIEDPPNVEEINPEQASNIDSDSVPELAEDPRLLEKELLELEQVLISADKDCQQQKSAMPKKSIPPRETADVTRAMQKIGVIIKSCSTSTKPHVKGYRRSFVCYKCNQKFTKRHAFIEHWLEHMEKILERLGTSAPRKFRFECERCKEKFVDMLQLELHLMEVCSVSNRDKSFKCYVCRKQFSSEEELEKHKASHYKYACSFCDKCCRSKSNLRAHMVVHIDLRPFKCSQCDASFKRKEEAKAHMITHSSDRPHICTQCNATFRKKHHLQQHLHSMHSGFRSYVCGDCGDRFKHPGSLRAHMISKHSNERPYQCKLCRRSFKFKEHLTKHMFTHLSDEDKPFKCHLCTYTACQNPHLRNHLRQKHYVF